MINNYIFYILIIVISAQTVLFVGMLFLLLRLISKRKNGDSDNKVDFSTENYLLESQNKAKKILEDAHSKAREMLLKSENYTKFEEDKISELLDKTTKIYANRYEINLQKTQEESLKIMKQIPEGIKNILSNQIQSIGKNIQDEVIKAEEQAKNVVLSAYQQAEKEVDRYKLERMRQVDESIIMILKNIARKVLTKEINIDEHEKLVTKSLEEAKKQNIFETNKGQ